MARSKKDSKSRALPPNYRSDYEIPDDNENGEADQAEALPTEKKSMDAIMQTGAIVTKNRDTVIHSITVIGQIEGHYALSAANKTTKYEHIIPMLVAVEENPEIDGLLILLNTVGGDVEAGLPLAEMIASMSKPTVSLVLGGGHSIGVPLAVCAKKSFMVPSATMTIHPVRTNGLVVGAEQSYAYFSKMQERINKFIVRHSNIDEDSLNELMFATDELATDIGTIIDGEQALESGLINHIGGLSDALGVLRGMIEKNRTRAKNEAKGKKPSGK